MKKATLVTCVLASCAVAGCAGDSEAPKIVEVFACSDNCPGPEEQYIKRIYEGVTDEEECRRLGGRIIEIVGWGTRRLCEVQ